MSSHESFFKRTSLVLKTSRRYCCRFMLSLNTDCLRDPGGRLVAVALVSPLCSIALCITSESNAKCVLPVPDGTDEIISSRNLAGRIQTINARTMKVEHYKTKQTVLVDVTKVPTAYSAYGGDTPTLTLTAEVPVKVWYRHCKQASAGTPVAAYVEFFSSNPADQPPKNYFSGTNQ